MTGYNLGHRGVNLPPVARRPLVIKRFSLATLEPHPSCSLHHSHSAARLFDVGQPAPTESLGYCTRTHSLICPLVLRYVDSDGSPTPRRRRKRRQHGRDPRSDVPDWDSSPSTTMRLRPAPSIVAPASLICSDSVAQFLLPARARPPSWTLFLPSRLVSRAPSLGPPFPTVLRASGPVLGLARRVRLVSPPQLPPTGAEPRRPRTRLNFVVVEDGYGCQGWVPTMAKALDGMLGYRLVDDGFKFSLHSIRLILMSDGTSTLMMCAIPLLDVCVLVQCAYCSPNRAPSPISL